MDFSNHHLYVQSFDVFIKKLEYIYTVELKCCRGVTERYIILSRHKQLFYS